MIPIILILGGSFVLLSVTGELDSPESVLNKQTQSPKELLIGFAYSNPQRFIKLHAALQLNPRVLIMGNSRIGQLRTSFFKNPSQVYNANIGGSKVQDLQIFLSNIPESSQPGTIIVGLDSNHFNAVCEKIDSQELAYEYTEEYADGNALRAWEYGFRQVYKDYLNGKFSLSQVFEKSDDTLGLQAKVRQHGYRKDGSINNEGEIAHLATDMQKRSQQLLGNFFKEGRLAECPEKADRATQELRNFLMQAKKRNIDVIGILMPYAHVVYEEMTTDPHYGYIMTLGKKLEAVFKEQDFRFFNIPDIELVGSTDGDMLDAVHVSERGTARILYEISQKDAKLRDQLNIRQIITTIEHTL